MELTRESVIAELSNLYFDTLSAEPDERLFVAKYGFKGFDNYTNDELLAAFWNAFEDMIECEFADLKITE